MTLPELIAAAKRLAELQAKATRRPWFCDDRDWRNRCGGFNRYIHGDVYEIEGQRIATAVAIVEGNATSGTIQNDCGSLIVGAVNVDFAELAAHLEQLSKQLAESEAGAAAIRKLIGWWRAASNAMSSTDGDDPFRDTLRKCAREVEVAMRDAGEQALARLEAAEKLRKLWNNVAHWPQEVQDAIAAYDAAQNQE